MNSLIVSLFCSILFGIIDSLFFLVGEEKLQLALLKVPHFDMNTAEIISGGISSALALFISMWIGTILTKKYKISVSPILHVIGIILGSIIIAILYILYVKIVGSKRKKRVRFVPGS